MPGLLKKIFNKPDDWGWLAQRKCDSNGPGPRRLPLGCSLHFATRHCNQSGPGPDNQIAHSQATRPPRPIIVVDKRINICDTPPPALFFDILAGNRSAAGRLASRSHSAKSVGYDNEFGEFCTVAPCTCPVFVARFEDDAAQNELSFAPGCGTPVCGAKFEGSQLQSPM
jgi:hypothetical protein